MRILVSNIGSTSFKFRLFEFQGGQERELAAGSVDRIGGSADGTLTFRLGGAGSTGILPVSPAGETPATRHTRPCRCADHGQAIRACLDELADAGVLADAADLSAVAFKAVMAGDCEPAVLVDEKVLAAMEYYTPAAPAHNPAYIAAMRSFRQALGPAMPLVAAFEPGFHRTIPPRRWRYAIPWEWQEKYGIRRYGYHGASHRYVSQRVAQLMPLKSRRVISCHLGGSSSVCAVLEGKSVATSMGFSPQTGLPQGTRVGDFDPYALALVARQTGMTLEQMLAELGGNGGLAALSGTSGDGRDIEQAAAAGDQRATLALEALATAVRDCIGAYLAEMGGADSIAFTGGMGEKSPLLRSMICRNLEFAGVWLDSPRNQQAAGEVTIHSTRSQVAVWVMPTNEELVVARQAAELLAGLAARKAQG